MYYNVKVFGKQLTMCNTFVSVYQLNLLPFSQNVK